MFDPQAEGFQYEPPGPVAEDFLLSDAFIRGIRGPVGSGKSVSCVMDMVRTAQMQPLYNGKRHYRGLVVRNTYGELESTTLKTFHMWFPQDLGRFVKSAPIVHHIQLGEMDMEFLFLALDRPEHVKKLLSLEVTQAWLNEAREIPKAILDAATVRVGRYPNQQMGGSVRAGVIMDTNSPDSDHWWPKMSDLADPQAIAETLALEQELREMGALPEGQKLMEFFTQPGAEGTDGRQNPNAENLANLPPGYYVKAKVGKTQDWINVYVRNLYGFVMDGRAVYPEYRDTFHTAPLAYSPDLSLHIGMDFGLTPAAVFAQRSAMGQVRILSELVATRLGAKNFAREVRAHLAEYYANARIGTITGDPAGNIAAQTDETTVFQVLEAEGVIAKPAHSNDFTIRREAVADGLTKIIDGQPAMVVNTSCRQFRKAMAGGYHFRRVRVSGDERFEDKPYKNMHSHVAEAGQYLMMGLGIGREVLIEPQAIQQKRQSRPKFAVMDYNPHG